LIKGKNATQTYSLKDTTGMFNCNEKMYSSAQKAFVGEQLRDMIFFFDYAQFESNYTGFFEYPDRDRELLYQKGGYVQTTDSVIQWVATLTEATMSKFQYQLTDKTKEVEVMTVPLHQQSSRAINDWSER